METKVNIRQSFPPESSTTSNMDASQCEKEFSTREAPQSQAEAQAKVRRSFHQERLSSQEKAKAGTRQSFPTEIAQRNSLFV